MRYSSRPRREPSPVPGPLPAPERFGRAETASNRSGRDRRRSAYAGCRPSCPPGAPRIGEGRPVPMPTRVKRSTARCSQGLERHPARIRTAHGCPALPRRAREPTPRGDAGPRMDRRVPKASTGVPRHRVCLPTKSRTQLTHRPARSRSQRAARPVPSHCQKNRATNSRRTNDELCRSWLLQD